MMKIIKTEIEKVVKFRSAYFVSLSEFQELFLEILVRDSLFFSINSHNADIGYAIVSKDGVLLEFYIDSKYMNESLVCFNKIIDDLDVKEIYCKSFDFQLLSCCLLNSFPYSVYGILYRDYVGSLIDEDSSIVMKKADISLSGFLLSQDSSIKELFETERQLSDFILNENVFLFYKENEFVGCGMVIKTHPEWNYCDLGIWVVPSKRGQSFGSQIILKLKDFAAQNYMIPSCGCGADNYSSQKAIEKSGFASRHKLIRFHVKSG